MELTSFPAVERPFSMIFMPVIIGVVIFSLKWCLLIATGVFTINYFALSVFILILGCIFYSSHSSCAPLMRHLTLARSIKHGRRLHHCKNRPGKSNEQILTASWNSFLNLMVTIKRHKPIAEHIEYMNNEAIMVILRLDCIWRNRKYTLVEA
jgi:hypothetical protein